MSEPLARVSTESSNVPELRSRLDGIERPELHAEHFRLGLRLGRHVSADNLVLVVLRREKTHHHRRSSVARLSPRRTSSPRTRLARARDRAHDREGIPRISFPHSRPSPSPRVHIHAPARALPRARRDRAETPNRSVAPSTSTRHPPASTRIPRASRRARAHRIVIGRRRSHAPSTSP